MLPDGDTLVDEYVYGRTGSSTSEGENVSIESFSSQPTAASAPPRTLKIILDGEVFESSVDSFPPSPEYAQEVVVPDLPSLSVVSTSSSSSSSGDSSSDNENISHSDLATSEGLQVGGRWCVATQVIDEVESKKRRATELLEMINSNLLELKKIKSELPSSPTSNTKIDMIQSQVESLTDSSQVKTTSMNEGGWQRG